jgi:hypothetical protein
MWCRRVVASLNSDLSQVKIYVTGGTTPVPDVGLFNVEVTGGDFVVSSPAPPTHHVGTPGGSAATLVLKSLEGITNVTFVNGIDIISGSSPEGVRGNVCWAVAQRRPTPFPWGSLP